MDDPIQKTAHDASSKKKHAVTKGYYDDPYIKLVAKDGTFMNSPLINRGQWLRVKAVEYTVSRFAQQYYGGSEAEVVGKPIQVVSIGAGMDTLYFRWAGNGGALDGCAGALPAAGAGGEQGSAPSPLNIVKYVEIDVPEMTSVKRGRIRANSVLEELIGKYPDVYHLLDGDLTDAEGTVEMLKPIIDPSVPTIVIAEMVFVYFPASQSTKLLTQLAGNLFAGHECLSVYVYDAINPNDRFGQTMIENLDNRGIKLKGINDLPSVDSHRDRLISCGFNSVKSCTMQQLHTTVPPRLKQRLNQVEMVDDWEEWDMIMDHYVVSIGSKSTQPGLPPSVFPPTKIPLVD